MCCCIVFLLHFPHQRRESGNDSAHFYLLYTKSKLRTEHVYTYINIYTLSIDKHFCSVHCSFTKVCFYIFFLIHSRCFIIQAATIARCSRVRQKRQAPPSHQWNEKGSTNIMPEYLRTHVHFSSLATLPLLYCYSLVAYQIHPLTSLLSHIHWMLLYHFNSVFASFSISITLLLSSTHFFAPLLHHSIVSFHFHFFYSGFFSSSYFCCIYCLIRFFPNAINKLTATQMVKCMFKNANHKRTQISINIQCREGCDEHREPNLRNSKAQLRKRQTSEANSCTMCNISIFIPPLSLCLSIEVVRLECVFVFHWARRGIARARTHTAQHNTTQYNSLKSSAFFYQSDGLSLIETNPEH